MASTPSPTTLSRLRTLPSSRASRVMSTSPSSSSTSSTSMGRTASASMRRIFLCRGRFRGRERQLELRAGRVLGLQPDATAVELDDLLGERQPDPGAGVVGLGVQTFEDGEDLLGVGRFDTYAVVGDRDDPLAPSDTVGE